MEKKYIVQGGKPCVTLVIAPDATEQERYAASELRYYLGVMGNSVFEIADHAAGPCIAIGKAAGALGVSAGPALGVDGFTLRTVGDSLAIVGGKRGVIYGAYELLERLGCRFFTPLCEKIPTGEDISLPEIDDTQVPVLEYREHNYVDLCRYTRFAVKCRLNGSHHPIREKHGGHISYVPGWYVHTFDTMVSREKYFATHPEYFSLVDGQRMSEPAQLCLTNPEVLALCIESVRQALREHPEAKIISVSQNDGYYPCECDNCRAVNEEEGSVAGSVLRFVNAVAEAIEPEFPDVIVDTLAYVFSRPAPKYVRPRKNVCVRLCSIECCFMHPLESCDDETRMVARPDGSRSSFMTDLEDWGKICNRMYIWDYTTCFAHYPTPHPNWNVLQPNIQAFVRNNVKGVFEQANGAIGGGVDLNELRAYLISKLLWDPYTDVEKHMQEFLEYYYGAAAPYIREYIRTLTDKVEKENIHTGFNDNPDKPYLTDEMLDIYDRLFDQAEQAVAGDPLRLWRVGKARLAIRYVRMKNDAMLKGIHDARTIRDFFSDWHAYGLTRIDEWCSTQTTHRALLMDTWRGIDFYKYWWEEGPEEL